MNKSKIVQTAIRHFNLLTGLEMQEINPPKRPPKRRQPDTGMKIQAQGKSYFFCVEVKNELRQMHLAHLVHQLKTDRENWLLLTQYISKPNREKLKEEGINYLDASGNCHIRRGALFLFINDRKVTPQRQPDTGKLWKSSGLRLIFALLLNPELANEPYRIISKHSKIGLGTIGPLLDELEKEGYFRHYNDAHHLENREALLNRWTETFHTILRPKLAQGKFRFATANDRNSWKNRNLNGIYWGGEPAGALLTGFLYPEKFTIYSELPKTEVMKQLHLVPDNSGEVELLKPFWNVEKISGIHPNAVSPQLAYAELNVSLDSRNRETAKRIKKEYNV